MSLPSGYTKLKYVRSTGAQAIFTGVSVDQDTRVVIDFQMDSSQTTEQHICSVRSSSSGPFFTAFYNGSLTTGKYRVRWASQAIQKFMLESGTDRMVLDFNKNSVTLGNTRLTFSAATFSISYPLTLFCRNTAGTCDAYAYMDMYSCQIYSGTTLVRDYIPCKNSSGVAGLWDDVGSTFYGSGTPLEAGPEVSSGGHSALINGTGYSILGGRTLIDGTGYSISKGRTFIDGTGYDITFPVQGTPLSAFEPGTLAYLNENGVRTPFVLAKHNYESDLNGAGRTLMVRLYVYGNMAWNSDSTNRYSSSTVHNWLTGTYKGLLDAEIQAAIALSSGRMAIPCTWGGGSTAGINLYADVFLLSATELGKASTRLMVEGTALGIADTLKVAYMNGSAAFQWTRSPDTYNTNNAAYLYTDGNVYFGACTVSMGVRPCFTLPETILVDKNNNVIV